MIGLFMLNPYLDIYRDSKGEVHVIFWYSLKGKRNFITIKGSHY